MLYFCILRSNNINGTYTRITYANTTYAQWYHCIFIKFDPAIHVNDYDSKSYNTNRYEYTDTYLKIFKSCKAIHHGYTMSIADTVQARFQSNVYSYENIEKTLPKHTKRLIKDS